MRGFTLVELLTAMMILGVISTFTIPKVISSSQNSSSNAKAKEIAAMVSEAYQTHLMRNSGNNGNIGISDLTPYFNYLAVDNSTLIDDKNNNGSQQCGSGTAQRCLRMHNGAILRYGQNAPYNMGGTAANNAIWFDVDADGSYSGMMTGSGKAVEFWLYYSGRLTTYGSIISNTCNSMECVNPNPSLDPSWFSW